MFDQKHTIRRKTQKVFDERHGTQIENGPHTADKIENRAHIAKEMKMIRVIFADTLAE